MDVILVKNVEKLGKEGEIVSVKSGYARNYLLPNKLAVISTPEAVKGLERRKKKIIAQEEKLKTEASAMAEKINSISCTIAVEAGVEDKIFGTITPEMVKNALRNEGIQIDKKQVIIEEEISKLGVYQIKVKIHTDIFATPRIWVVKK